MHETLTARTWQIRLQAYVQWMQGQAGAPEQDLLPVATVDVLLPPVVA